VRRKIRFVQGSYYHIYNRGAGRQTIFRDEAGYTYVLRAMKKYSAQFGIAIIAYCLMPNHYHWLIRQDGELSAHLLPQRVFNGYTKAFNIRYSRSGTLFEGPFKARQIDSDEYLRHLCRYIHANPLKDGIAFHLDMWPYSNVHEWLGLRKGTLLDAQFVNDFFPDREGYRTWVLDYVRTRQLPEALANYLTFIEDGG
jgi:putative transposase